MSGAKRARVLATTSLGLVALTLLYLLAIPRLAERIPVALEQAAENRLDTQGMAWAGASADGRNLRLKGEAPSPEALRAALDTAMSVPWVRRVTDDTRLRSVSPFTLSMDWQDNRLELDGYMPDEQSLQALTKNLDARPWMVNRNLVVAAGAPEGWSNAVAGVINGISALDSAEVELVDQRLSLTGLTTSVEARERARDALAGLAELGFVLDLDLTAIVSPYTMTLIKDSDTLKAQGYVPDQASERRFAETLAGTQGAASDDVVLRVAGGAPDGWTELLSALGEGLGRFIEAEAELKDRELHLAGTVATTVQRDRLVEKLLAFEQQGFRLHLDLAAADEAAVRCQQRLDQLLLTRIAFASGDVRIGVDSDPLLRDLAAALKSCPEARVFIAGHTDDQGAAEDNLLLSKRRAEAVAERLISEGVERQRIETSGYGSERPVADNNTEAGRAKNRRIEFVVEAGL